MWLLPQNPGPFGTLRQWEDWHAELRKLGPATVGVDFELAFAEKWIRDLRAESSAKKSNSSEFAVA